MRIIPQKPNVEKIVYQLFGNEDTMYLALQQGDIDMVWAYSTGVAGTYQDVLSTDANVSLANGLRPMRLQFWPLTM